MLDRLLQSGIPLEKGLLPAHARLAGDPQMLQQRLIPEVLQIVFANRAEVAAALVAFSQRIWDENVAADLADLADQPQLTGLDQKLLSIGLEAARRLEETPETPSRFFHLGAEAKEIRVAARTDLFANIISSQFIVTGSAEDRDAMKRCRPEPTA